MLLCNDVVVVYTMICMILYWLYKNSVSLSIEMFSSITIITNNIGIKSGYYFLQFICYILDQISTFKPLHSKAV